MKLKNGDRVKVVRCGLISNGCIGTVIQEHISYYPNSVMVRLDNSVGKYNCKIIYIRRDNLIKIEEENQMAVLTGFNKVAVIEMCGREYHYALYDEDIQAGDQVLVSGTASGTIRSVKEVLTVEEAKLRYKSNINEEIICMVDTSEYDARVEKRKEATQLKKDMDKIIKKMDEVNKYEMYANQNLELAAMLAKYKELVG